MATTQDFAQFVCDQIADMGAVRMRKMFGEYMVYLNDKPILLLCDNIVFVKKLEGIAQDMAQAVCGVPYEGAKEHHILDVENQELTERVVTVLE